MSHAKQQLNMSKDNREGRLASVIGLMLVFGTLACYWPARHFDFINFDDGLYVYQTPIVEQGLTWPGFVWSFKSVEGGNWNPLIWLSHMADCQFYGLNPGGHHMTNVLLHTVNALLIFLILRSMTGSLWRSACVAAIFAWHPMHVESVAWVAERKDVLSTLFFLLTLGTYARFVKAEGQGRKVFYGLALFLFALGLMCKPMLVTVPFLLLLLDYWPLQRAERIGRLVLEKLPFLVLSAGACAVAIWAQHSVGALGTTSALLRLENTAVSYATYVGKLFWPVNLVVFYPYPNAIPRWQAGTALALLLLISWAVIRERKTRPFLAVGWFWYLGTLVPVIGLVQVGMQALADRYTYIPYIGLAMMISWGAADLAAAWPRIRPGVIAVIGSALFFCAAATCAQLRYWQNSAALYDHALKIIPDNYIAHSNLGDMLLADGKLDEAMKHFQEVVRLVPAAALPYNNLGKTYALQNRMEQAMAMFSKAIALNPGLAEAHYNLGNAFLQRGQFTKAMAEFKTALRLKPDDLPPQERLATALIKTGHAADAIPYDEAVVKERPQDAQAHVDLGTAYLAQKRFGEAMTNFQTAARLAPNSPQCLNSAAWLYATCPQAKYRNGAEAMRLAAQACQINHRQSTSLLDTLAAACAEAGQFEQAIKTTEEIRALALAAHDTKMVDIAEQRLTLYKAGKPYRDEP